MRMSDLPLSVLQIVDQPGHILERISLSYARNSSSVAYQIVLGNVHTNYSLCSRAKQVGIVHWIDALRFTRCGPGISVPQVVMVHHLTEDQIPTMLEKLNLADAITTSSIYWQNKLQKLTKRPIFLLPYPIDITAFPYQEDCRNERCQAGFASDEFVLGFVGKAKADHAGRKGVTLFLDVVRAAVARWKSLRLVLVGPGWEKLTQTIENLGVRVSHFSFSTTEETIFAYRLMDALIVTSTEEGGPCTILEAMCCGVPVITSIVGHVPEVIEHGETGILCPQRSVDEYIEGLSFIRQNPEARKQMIRQARIFVEQKRDERIIVPSLALDTLYREASASFKKRAPLTNGIRSLNQVNFYMRHLGHHWLPSSKQ